MTLLSNVNMHSVYIFHILFTVKLSVKILLCLQHRRLIQVIVFYTLNAINTRFKQIKLNIEIKKRKLDTKKKLIITKNIGNHNSVIVSIKGYVH